MPLYLLPPPGNTFFNKEMFGDYGVIFNTLLCLHSLWVMRSWEVISKISFFPSSPLIYHSLPQALKPLLCTIVITSSALEATLAHSPHDLSVYLGGPMCSIPFGPPTALPVNSSIYIWPQGLSQFGLSLNFWTCFVPQVQVHWPLVYSGNTPSLLPAQWLGVLVMLIIWCSCFSSAIAIHFCDVLLHTLQITVSYQPLALLMSVVITSPARPSECKLWASSTCLCTATVQAASMALHRAGLATVSHSMASLKHTSWPVRKPHILKWPRNWGKHKNKCDQRCSKLYLISLVIIFFWKPASWQCLLGSQNWYSMFYNSTCKNCFS